MRMALFRGLFVFTKESRRYLFNLRSDLSKDSGRLFHRFLLVCGIGKSYRYL